MSQLELAELIGNKAIRTQLTIAHGAARLNNTAMGHMLKTGLPGTGKTTSARALASLSGLPFIEASPESLKTPEDLAKIFFRFPINGYDAESGEKIGSIMPPIVFIDEAHRLTRKTEEMLGIAMEEHTHTYVMGHGRKKQTLTDWVPEFTLICATTKEGELSKPFRDRFKFIFVFNEYSLEESKAIVKLHAEKKDIKIDSVSIDEIANRGRGTPRMLVRYLDNINDSKTYLDRDSITVDLARAQFSLGGIDPKGLTETDVSILKDLYMADMPIGLDSLAVKTNIDPRTIEDVNEPYLIRLGFMERSKGGRVITEAGEAHLISYNHIDTPASNILTSRTIKRSKAR